jgi:hypothetical protein
MLGRLPAAKQRFVQSTVYTPCFPSVACPHPTVWVVTGTSCYRPATQPTAILLLNRRLGRLQGHSLLATWNLAEGPSGVFENHRYRSWRLRTSKKMTDVQLCMTQVAVIVKAHVMPRESSSTGGYLSLTTCCNCSRTQHATCALATLQSCGGPTRGC